MASSDTLHWKRNLVLMWLSQLLILSGFAAVMPFIPLFLKDQLGIIAEGERGIYMSMFYFFGVLGYAMFCPIWGSLADRFGVRPMLLRGTFVTAFIFPLMGYVTSAWMLIALRFLSAACAGTTAAAQTLIVKNTPEDKQGFALGTLSTAIWGGTMLGNVIGGVVVHYYGYKFTFIACGVMYFIAGIFVLFAKDDFKPEKSTASPYVEKIRHYRRSPLPAFTVGVWLMFVLFIFLGFVRYFEIPYMAMMVEIIDGPANAAYWTGIISAFVAVGALLSGVVTGYLADKVRPSLLIIPSLLISAVTLVLQACSHNLWVFGGSRTLMYFAAGGLIPVFQKILSGATPKRKRGAVFGWASTAQNVGIMLSTVFAGWVIFAFGTRGVFYTTAILTIVFLPVALWIVRRTMLQPFYVAHANKKPCEH